MLFGSVNRSLALAQVLIEGRLRGIMAYSDGVITRRNTFQKNYSQEELKSYPVALGIYLVFRDEAQAQTFRASRFRSPTTTPRDQGVTMRLKGLPGGRNESPE